MRLVVGSLALLVAVGSVAAEITGPSDACSGLTAALVPLGYEQLTVSTTVVSLTKSQYDKPAGVAVAAFAQVAEQAIRVRDDGALVDATNGLPFAVDDTFWICGPSIGRFQAIRAAAPVALLNVLYYRQ